MNRKFTDSQKFKLVLHSMSRLVISEYYFFNDFTLLFLLSLPCIHFSFAVWCVIGETVVCTNINFISYVWLEMRVILY